MTFLSTGGNCFSWFFIFDVILSGKKIPDSMKFRALHLIILFVSFSQIHWFACAWRIYSTSQLQSDFRVFMGKTISNCYLYASNRSGQFFWELISILKPMTKWVLLLPSSGFFTYPTDTQYLFKQNNLPVNSMSNQIFSFRITGREVSLCHPEFIQVTLIFTSRRWNSKY